MKTEDINEFELGEHCFGNILRINGKDYEDLDKAEILEFINDMLLNDSNSSSLIYETLENCLNHLQFESTESTSDKCDQCGHWNQYAKFIK